MVGNIYLMFTSQQAIIILLKLNFFFLIALFKKKLKQKTVVNYLKY